MAGKSAVLQEFKLDDVGDTLRDYSAYLTGSGVSLQRQIDMLDATNAGDTSKEYVTGLKDATFDIEIQYDATYLGYLDGVYEAGGLTAGTPLNFEYYPGGNVSTHRKYSGVCYVTNVQINTAVAGLITITASIQVSGNVTSAAVA